MRERPKRLLLFEPLSLNKRSKVVALESFPLAFNADVKYWLGLDPSRWDEELRSQIVVGDIGYLCAQG